MKLIIDIDKEKYIQIINSYQGSNVRPKDYEIAIINGTPIQTGKWIRSLIYENIYNCSKCGSSGYGTFKYCPNRGAKMESEDKE